MSRLSILVTSPIVFPRRRYKDGVPAARQTPDPRLRNRRCKDGVPAVRQTPDPRPLVFPRRRCHAFDCGSFQMRHHHILHDVHVIIVSKNDMCSIVTLLASPYSETFCNQTLLVSIGLNSTM